MRLKTRLTLGFLVLAWGPLGATTWVLSRQAQQDFEQTFEERRRSVERAVQARLARTGSELEKAVASIGADPILRTELLEPLARDLFYDADQPHRRTIVTEAQRLITSAAVDTLRLVDLDRGGHVIAMGHRRGEEADDALAVRWAKATPGDSALRRERVENPETGATDEVWTLQVLRVVGERVAVIAGRVLDKHAVGEWLVGAGGGAQASLDAGGKRVAATFDAADPPSVGGGYEMTVSELAELSAGEQGETGPATLRVYLSRAPLTEQIERLYFTVGTVAGGVGLFALILGMLISRRLTRPLERLAEAANQVAGGDRDVVVPELRGRDEIAQLTRAFNAMTLDLGHSEERLKQSERVAAWREIARRIAHEIKNPLFPIQMSIETLKKVHERQHPDFEEIFHESTETILEEVERMKRIVTEFSDFARMPAPKPGELDVVELTADVLRFHEDTAPDVTLQLDAPGRVILLADADQLRQVLTNLVQNAIDALTDEAGGAPRLAVPRLVVAIRDGDPVVLTFTDNGPGIDETTRDKLFTPYFTTKVSGTGLGLAIVHRIVAEHGGAIAVSSTEGHGTTFSVTLPRGGAPPTAE